MRYHIPLCAVVLCIVVAKPLHAQRTADTLTSKRLDSVIVTATRHPEALGNIPMAASHVSAEDFASGRGYELKDALKFVPGVFTQTRSGHTDLRITIRGFGARGAANRSNAGNMRGIRVLIDGVPETEPDGRTSLDLIHLEATSHLDVLRSNASTLYGSASGGVINLRTNTDFSESFVETRNTAGSFGFLRNTLSAGAAMGNTRMFVALTNTTYGDENRRAYREHSSSSQLLGTMAIESWLTPDTRLGVSASATSNLFRFPGPLTRAQMDSDDTQANADYVKRDERRFNRQGRLAVTLDHSIAGGHNLGANVYLQPKVLERSERGTYRDFNRYGIGAQARYAFTADLSASLRNRIAVGFDEQYQDGTALFYSLTAAGSRGDVLQQNKQEAANTMGAYLDEMLWFGKDWTLSLGARYDRINYLFRDFTVPEPAGGAQRKEFTHLTPKGSVGYHFASGHMAYASVGGGLEAAAYNEVDPPSDSLVIARGGIPDTLNSAFNPLLEPTTSVSYEIGTRGYLPLDGLFESLNYDVAAYLITINNDIIPWDGGRYYFTAGKSRRTGVELALSLVTSANLTIVSAFTIGTSTYLEYENQLGHFDNNKTAGLPTVHGNVKLRYDAPAGLFVEAGLEHVGEYYADDRNDKKPDGTPDASINSLVPAYTIFNATAGWSGNLGPIGLDAFAGAHNLADMRYVGSAFINGEKNMYFEPGMPFNLVFGLTIRYR